MKQTAIAALALSVWIISFSQNAGQPSAGVFKKKSGADAQSAEDAREKQKTAETTALNSILTTIAKNEQDRAAERQQEAAVESENVHLQRWIIGVGIAQTVALIVQAFVFGFTLWMIKRQADIMREHAGHLENLATAAGRNAEAALLSAQATANQTEHLSDTAVRQLRAYVGVDSAVLKFPQPDVPEAQVHFRNFGQTPAYDFRVWIHTWFAAYPLQEGLPTAPNSLRMGMDVLGPGRKSIMIAPKKPPLPPQYLVLLGTTQFTFYVYGEIRYRDVFGQERRTEYRLIYGGAEGVRQVPGKEEWLLGPDSEGNKAT